MPDKPHRQCLLPSTPEAAGGERHRHRVRLVDRDQRTGQRARRPVPRVGSAQRLDSADGCRRSPTAAAGADRRGGTGRSVLSHRAAREGLAGNLRRGDGWRERQRRASLVALPPASVGARDWARTTGTVGSAVSTATARTPAAARRSVLRGPPALRIAGTGRRLRWGPLA